MAQGIRQTEDTHSIGGVPHRRWHRPHDGLLPGVQNRCVGDSDSGRREWAPARHSDTVQYRVLRARCSGGVTQVTAEQFSEDDFAPADKPRPKGALPWLPDREASFSVLRQWVSNAIGLPATVRVEAVTRYGRDDEDSLSISLSNEVVIRCNRQKRLQSPGTFQAFFASESDGLCQPKYLTRAECGDVYVALCRLGTADAAVTELDMLRERLDMFTAMCDTTQASLLPQWRYVTIAALKQRTTYDPKIPGRASAGARARQAVEQAVRPASGVRVLPSGDPRADGE